MWRTRVIHDDCGVFGTVVTNGKILTVDAAFSVVEALAINDSRIVARGTSAEVARYAGPNTKIIDVKGATVIPGLIDNHFHFARAVERWHGTSRPASKA
jgi:predicted amidohydrolase YtcJ